MKKIILLAALSLPVISGCATNGVGPIAKMIYSAQTPDTTIEACQSQSFIGGPVQRFESAVFGSTSLKPYYCGSQQFCFAKGYLHAAVSLDKSDNMASVECWKSLDRQALAHELQQQGHQLNWTDRGSLQFELASVSKNVTESFSQRREAIERQVSLWKAAGEHKNVSESKLYEMATLGTREAKNQNITKEEVQQLWKNGAEKAGISLEAIKADVEASRTIEKKTESLTAEKAVSEAARILTDNEAVIDRVQLMQTSARVSGGQHDIKTLSEAIDKNTVSLGQDTKGCEL